MFGLLKKIIIGGAIDDLLIDAILATLIFSGLVLLGINLVMSNKFNLKEKLCAVGTPGSILVLALIVGMVGNAESFLRMGK